MLLAIELRQHRPQHLCAGFTSVHCWGCGVLKVANRRARSSSVDRDQRHTVAAHATPAPIRKRNLREDVGCEFHVLAPAFGAARALRRDRAGVGPTAKDTARHVTPPKAERAALGVQHTLGQLTLTQFPADHNAPRPPRRPIAVQTHEQRFGFGWGESGCGSGLPVCRVGRVRSFDWRGSDQVGKGGRGSSGAGFGARKRRTCPATRSGCFVPRA